MNQDRANAAIERLSTAYPQTFFVYEQRRRPLKISIHLDLADVMPEDELNLALGIYTRNTGYLYAMREGAERIDLSGNPVDMVTAEQAVGAAGRVKARMQRKQEATRARKEEAERKAAEEASKRYTDAWTILDKLEELYPLAFFVKARKRRRPLKLDILKGIIDAGATVLVEAEVENALRLYTGSKDYLKGLKEDVERIDLAGELTGSLVTADEAAAATAYLERIERRRQERKTEAHPIPVAAPQLPIPEMVVIPETEQPRRLSLDDLRTAAKMRKQKEFSDA